MVTSALWYITNQHQTFRGASFHSTLVKPVPSVWDDFQGFNDVKRKKVKECPMSRDELLRHARDLKSLCVRPSLDTSDGNRCFRKEIESLSDCLQGYATYLKEKLEEVQTSQASARPHHQVQQDTYVLYREGTENIRSEYQELNETVKNSDMWCPVFVDTAFSLDKMQRQRFIAQLQLQCPVGILKYVPGGSQVQVIYIWKIDPAASADTLSTHAARICTELRERLPEYHTRAMRMEFRMK